MLRSFRSQARLGGFSIRARFDPRRHQQINRFQIAAFERFLPKSRTIARLALFTFHIASEQLNPIPVIASIGHCGPFEWRVPNGLWTDPASSLNFLALTN